MTQFIELSVGVAAVVAFVVLSAVALAVREFLRERRERRRMKRLQAAGMHLPASLHPVIDVDRCISSAACVAACPEGDVLGLVEGAGRLVHGAACVGHGQCAAECPVQAIHLVFGTAERGVDIPVLTATFETNRPGVYIAGELGGMGLVRNAIRQGVAAAKDAITKLSRTPHDAGFLDVVVVGSGPAGLGAGLACVEAGITYAVLEQNSVGGTVAHYPRHKVVLTEPVEVPLFGTIHRAEMSKEELLSLWSEVISETGLQIRVGTKLEQIEGQDGAFTLKTSAGDLKARKVVLAIGRRGTPRHMECEGEEAPHVVYALTDPEQYDNAHVAVVGGGDSAIEAAVALAQAKPATVTLVYRGESFFRAKEKNRLALAEQEKLGRIRILLKAQVQRIEPGRLWVQRERQPIDVPADYVLALLGGEPPTALLERLQIRIDRWFGSAPTKTATGTHLHTVSRGMADFMTAALLLIGGGMIAYLTYRGRAYYPLDADARELSPLHAMLRSSGMWGHGIGIAATAVMLTNFLYAARKRLAWFRSLGPIRHWLTVHVVVGLLTPAIIAFHAAFQNKNLIAAVSYYAVGLVVVTGIIGRFLYGRAQGRNENLTATRKHPLKRLMRGWRLIHLTLALLMVVTIIIHVAVSLLLGYRWIL